MDIRCWMFVTTSWSWRDGCWCSSFISNTSSD